LTTIKLMLQKYYKLTVKHLIRKLYESELGNYSSNDTKFPWLKNK
jgi:hypothetical protein